MSTSCWTFLIFEKKKKDLSLNEAKQQYFCKKSNQRPTITELHIFQILSSCQNGIWEGLLCYSAMTLMHAGHELQTQWSCSEDTSATGFLTLMVWRLWYSVSAAKLLSFSVLLLNNGSYVLHVCLFVRYYVTYLTCIILFPPDNPVKCYYCCWSTCEETKAAGGYCSY